MGAALGYNLEQKRAILFSSSFLCKLYISMLSWLSSPDLHFEIRNCVLAFWVTLLVADSRVAFAVSYYNNHIIIIIIIIIGLQLSGLRADFACFRFFALQQQSL